MLYSQDKVLPVLPCVARAKLDRRGPRHQLSTAKEEGTQPDVVDMGCASLRLLSILAVMIVRVRTPRKAAGNGEPKEAEPQRVHRLDRETSGVMIFGKTADASADLINLNRSTHALSKQLRQPRLPGI